VYEDGVQDDVDEEEFAATSITYSEVPPASLEYLQKQLEALMVESKTFSANDMNDSTDSVSIDFAEDTRAVELNAKKLKERIVHEKVFDAKSSSVKKQREKKEKVKQQGVKVKSRNAKTAVGAKGEEGEMEKKRGRKKSKSNDGHGPKDPLCDRYIQKIFDGFGSFFGIVKSFADDLYKVALSRSFII
jgi:hypothetical protein